MAESERRHLERRPRDESTPREDFYVESLFDFAGIRERVPAIHGVLLEIARPSGAVSFNRKT